MPTSSQPSSASNGHEHSESNEYTADTYLTFVVHGVGAPKAPGQYVDGATNSFANTWGERNNIPLRRTTYNAHPTVGGSVEYSVFDASEEDAAMKCEGKKHKIVELQWADLSPAPSGFFGPILAFMKLLLGLRKMSRASINILDDKFERPGWRRSVSDTLLHMIEGPILGLNLVLLAAYMIAIIWPANLELAPCWAAAIAGIVGMVVLLIPGKLEFKPWSAMFGGALLVLAFYDSVSETFNPGFINYMQGFNIAILILGIIANAGMAFVVLFWLVYRGALSQEKKRTYEVQVFVAALATRLWMTLIPVLWFFAYWLALSTSSFNSGLITAEHIQALQSGGTPLYGLNWFILLLILTGAAITANNFRKHAPTEREYADNTRIIAGSALVGTVMLSTVLYLVGIVWVISAIWDIVDVNSFRELGGALEQLSALFSSEQEMQSRGLGILKISSNYGWIITGAIGLMAFFFREGIRTGVDFALDVTMYFEQKAAMTPSNPEGKHEHNKPYIHETIMARFHAVVDDVLHRTSGSKKITFVTHSQGTALTGDFLSEKKIQEATLVTMGSPISHIYEYYFSPNFWNKEIPHVGSAIGRWFNLHRDADYIGKEVLPKALNSSENEKEINQDVEDVKNRMVGKGGHTGYFEDDRIHNVLETEGLIPFNHQRNLAIEPEKVVPGNKWDTLAFWGFLIAAGLSLVYFLAVLFTLDEIALPIISLGIAVVLGVLTTMFGFIGRGYDKSGNPELMKQARLFKELGNVLLTPSVLASIVFLYVVFSSENASWGISFLAIFISIALAFRFLRKTSIDDRVYWNRISHKLKKELAEDPSALVCEPLIPVEFEETKEQSLQDRTHFSAINGLVWVREKSTDPQNPLPLEKWEFSLELPEDYHIKHNDAVQWEDLLPLEENPILNSVLGVDKANKKLFLTLRQEKEETVEA